jgi:hypothetical protein
MLDHVFVKNLPIQNYTISLSTWPYCSRWHFPVLYLCAWRCIRADTMNRINEYLFRTILNFIFTWVACAIWYKFPSHQMLYCAIRTDTLVHFHETYTTCCILDKAIQKLFLQFWWANAFHQLSGKQRTWKLQEVQKWKAI